jgi:hypothetical protein
LGTYLIDTTFLEIGKHLNAEQLTANSSITEVVAELLEGGMTPETKEARC